LQRAERVVALYFNVRIRVRVGAKRASLLATRSHKKTKKFPCLHIFGGGVRGGADKRLKGYFFVFGSPLKVRQIAKPPESSII
jgi:hypothetical protein